MWVQIYISRPNFLSNGSDRMAKQFFLAWFCAVDVGGSSGDGSFARAHPSSDRQVGPKILYSGRYAEY
jgi:hypothetical protein